MRVLYFSQSYSPHDYRFLHSLGGTYHEVFYLRLGTARTETRYLPTPIQETGWEFGQRNIVDPDHVEATRAFEQIVGSVRPDLIHAGPLPSCAYIATRQGKVPVLSLSHGWDVIEDNLSVTGERTVNDVIFRSAGIVYDCVTALRKKETVSPANRAVIPWGIRLDQFKFRPKTRNQYYVILHNRPMTAQYGADVMLIGFLRARQKMENLRLIIVCDRLPVWAALMIQKAGAKDSVWVTGIVPENCLSQYYHLSDLYLSASPVDGTSISLLNAMACGNNVLVTRTSPNLEWVEDSNTFSAGNSKDLSEKIIEISHRDSISLHTTRIAHRSLVEARGDWSKNFRKLIGTYKECVEAGKL